MDQRHAVLAHPRRRHCRIAERELDRETVHQRAQRERELHWVDARWRAAIADVVREGQAGGEFGDEDPEAFALTLAALMDGFAIQLALRDPAVTPELVKGHCMALVEERLGLEGVTDGG